MRSDSQDGPRRVWQILMATRIVVLTDRGASYVVEGDVDEARFAPGTPLAGKALPILLAEGWSVSSVGGKGRVFILERVTSPPGGPMS